ncbi:hypothetical protein DP46_6030 [Burkholderia phage BEK]|uniref:Uncharacterized protein n=1 Tax=Burkholderia phage BEK TaxID=1514988 RepID=A0A4P1QFI5_9CAUD|nr:hypothetical protein DP46_6030 [Burkholderia phage BEK]
MRLLEIILRKRDELAPGCVRFLPCGTITRSRTLSAHTCLHDHATGRIAIAAIFAMWWYGSHLILRGLVWSVHHNVHRRNNGYRHRYGDRYSKPRRLLFLLLCQREFRFNWRRGVGLSNRVVGL